MTRMIIALGIVALLSACSETDENESSNPFEVVNDDPSSSGDMDCIDFDTRADAQRFFEASGSDDPHDLDRDNDGLACEHIPY